MHYSNGTATFSAVPADTGYSQEANKKLKEKLASKKVDCAEWHRLICEGADPNIGQPWKLVHFAARDGKLDILCDCIRRGHELDDPLRPSNDNEIYTALTLAAHNRHFAACELLARAGAKTHAGEDGYASVDKILAGHGKALFCASVVKLSALPGLRLQRALALDSLLNRIGFLPGPDCLELLADCAAPGADAERLGAIRDRLQKVLAPASPEEAILAADHPKLADACAGLALLSHIFGTPRPACGAKRGPGMP